MIFLERYFSHFEFSSFGLWVLPGLGFYCFNSWYRKFCPHMNVHSEWCMDMAYELQHVLHEQAGT